MRLLTLIPSYLIWHYTAAFRAVVSLWGDMLWFVYNFFSVPTLLRTLVAPWKRMREERREGFHPGEFFSAFAINTIMRLVGMIVRGTLLVIAAIFLVSVFFAGAVVLILWPLLPIFVCAFVVVGVGLIVKNI